MLRSQDFNTAVTFCPCPELPITAAAAAAAGDATEPGPTVAAAAQSSGSGGGGGDGDEAEASRRYLEELEGLTQGVGPTVLVKALLGSNVVTTDL